MNGPTAAIDIRALRIARHTARLAEVTEFYRDGVGLREIGGFREHRGYSGVFLEVPGTGSHLELTAGGTPGAPQPHPESLLVPYLGDHETVDAALARIGREPVTPANPYWAEHGVTVEDPDGFRVVLVPEPWRPDGTPVEIGEHEGPRNELRGLFELAEDSQRRLDAYIDSGRLLVARTGGVVAGHLQLIETDAPARLEIKNTAVLPPLQGRGIGRALVDAAFALARGERRTTLIVATAAADVANLRFYQRAGFRMRSVERDAFTAETGYSAGLTVDGIELRDRVWLDAHI